MAKKVVCMTGSGSLCATAHGKSNACTRKIYGSLPMRLLAKKLLSEFDD
jgi:hypothetical protein